LEHEAHRSDNSPRSPPGSNATDAVQCRRAGILSSLSLDDFVQFLVLTPLDEVGENHQHPLSRSAAAKE
jgi:hypothetical protein